MKGDDAKGDDAKGDDATGPRPLGPDETEWRTGTYLDLFTPIYRALLMLGIKEHEARQMDITNVALTLGVPAPGIHGPTLEATVEQAPQQPERPGEHVPGSAPANIPAPKWWRGNQAAFERSTGAAASLGHGFVNVPRGGG